MGGHEALLIADTANARRRGGCSGAAAPRRPARPRRVHKAKWAADAARLPRARPSTRSAVVAPRARPARGSTKSSLPRFTRACNSVLAKATVIKSGGEWHRSPPPAWPQPARVCGRGHVPTRTPPQPPVRRGRNASNQFQNNRQRHAPSRPVRLWAAPRRGRCTRSTMSARGLLLTLNLERHPRQAAPAPGPVWTPLTTPLVPPTGGGRSPGRCCRGRDGGGADAFLPC